MNIDFSSTASLPPLEKYVVDIFKEKEILTDVEYMKPYCGRKIKHIVIDDFDYNYPNRISH